MDTLYHYTDLHAFLSIIKSKKLWLTGAHNLNDHQEISWTTGKIHKRLSKLSEQEKDVKKAEMLWGLFNAGLGMPYICSLSSESDVLSQWRAYSKDATGVSIGFKVSALPNLTQIPILTAALKDSLTLQKVIYEETEQEKILDNVFAPVIALEGLNTEAELLTMSYAASQLNGLACIFKNEAFHEEKEWRLIHRPLITGHTETFETNVMLSISKPQYRISENRLVTYFEHTFDKPPTQIFSELVLGPKCGVSDSDLRLLLSEEGLGTITVRRSKATYR